MIGFFLRQLDHEIGKIVIEGPRSRIGANRLIEPLGLASSFDCRSPKERQKIAQSELPPLPVRDFEYAITENMHRAEVRHAQRGFLEFVIVRHADEWPPCLQRQDLRP